MIFFQFLCIRAILSVFSQIVSQSVSQHIVSLSVINILSELSEHTFGSEFPDDCSKVTVTAVEGFLSDVGLLISVDHML